RGPRTRPPKRVPGRRLPRGRTSRRTAAGTLRMSPAGNGPKAATGPAPQHAGAATGRTAADRGPVARTTVVIATRNRAPELARTLAELRALRPRPDIVVLDNASEDDTTAVAGAFAGVTVVRLPRNLGAAARNLGVELARTPYIAFSDDDSWWA